MRTKMNPSRNRQLAPNPNGSLSRRTFLGKSIGIVAGLDLASAGSLCAAPGQKRLQFMVSLSQISLRRALAAKQFEHLDFPRIARQDYGIEAIELESQFFSDKAKDHDYLVELKRRAEDQGVHILLVKVSDAGALGDADPAKRKLAVENHRPWVEAASALDCHSLAVNADSGGVGSLEDQANRTAEGLIKLSQFGAKNGLNIIIASHEYPSSSPAWVLEVIKKVSLPACGTLPDIGGPDVPGGKPYDHYRGLAELMPFAKAVGANSVDFDSAGNETLTNYARMVRIVVDAGYHGYVGIHYQGERLSESDGIQATKRLLERVREGLPQA